MSLKILLIILDSTPWITNRKNPNLDRVVGTKLNHITNGITLKLNQSFSSTPYQNYAFHIHLHFLLIFENILYRVVLNTLPNCVLNELRKNLTQTMKNTSQLYYALKRQTLDQTYRKHILTNFTSFC